MTKAAIIGGGVSGLTVAYRLLQKGLKVKLFESSDKLGGLARTIKVQGKSIELYYHHFFPTDDYFLNLCKEIHIYDKISWLGAKMGYFSDGNVFDFGTPLSLFAFSPLSLSGKIRLGLSVLKIKREKSLERIDTYTVQEWLTKNVGKKVFDIFWKPLLMQKFGKCYKDVSMAWLWRKLHVRSLSNMNMLGDQKLAYLDGSLEIFINKMKDRIIHLDGDIMLSQRMKKIVVANVNKYTLCAENSVEKFDVVISTVCPAILNNLVAFPNGFNNILQDFKYLGVISVLLVVTKRLTPYYWLNIGDISFPFGLVVEHTNFCDPKNYNGRHIIYLSKYLDTSEAVFSHFTDEEVVNYFLKHLGRINAKFHKDWIEEVYVFRDYFAQPIIGVNYAKTKPNYSTSLPGFYWISAAHIYPDDRGVNYAIKIAEEVAENF